ncbi:MAG: glycosyltransferase family 4 protein [Crocinitomicaceae bacterium]
MKLLILTQYYPPEIGAPQNRLHELAVRLKKEGVDVEVLTAMPNYPKMEVFEKYKDGSIREEEIEGVKVYRSKIYVSKSKSILPRLLNYFSFVWTSYWRGRKLGKYDFLMVESPPLFLGYSAMRLSKKLKAKMIFNVSDLWPESAEKMGVVTNKQLLGLAYRLEKKCYRKAHLVTGQTQGIVDNIHERFPSVNTYWLPNGVDVNFYQPEKIELGDFRERAGLSATDVVFFYGGILGHAQGLSVVLEAAKKIEGHEHIKIVLQGAGPEKEELLALKKSLDLKNVVFMPPVEKSQMPGILKSVDVALVPLRKLDIFQGAIPSKIFEALAMKKPLLLGVDGEARTHFIEKAKAGKFFEPENVDDLAENMVYMADNTDELIQMGERARVYVTENFNRDNIAQKFHDALRSN